MRLLYQIFTLCTLFVLCSCSRKALLIFIKPPKKFAEARLATAPNYALSNHWHQAKHRFKNKKVDVFFVHPTTYIKARYWNQPLDHAPTNWRTEVLPICYQASLFYEDCNVFIPKYRQAAFYSFVDKKGNGTHALAIAYQDVKAAFDYYWKHLNQGRPFILAGHSQGSLHLQQLLAEVMEDSSIRQRLILTYAIGWPITQSYITQQPFLSVCTTATQTACVVSWNTQSPQAKFSIKEALDIKEPIVCVNPLNWTIDSMYIPRFANKGALMYNKVLHKDEVLLHYTDAQIVDDLLLTTPPSTRQRLQTPLVKGNYHIYDYNLFYYNIKSNIKTRIQAYHNTHVFNDNIGSQ